MALLLGACVWSQDTTYVVQPNPPDGVHVTLTRISTIVLDDLSDQQRAGVDKAAELRVLLDEPDLFCSTGTRERGDRCAFRFLQLSEPDGFLQRTYYSDAVRDDEFEEFVNDSMMAVRAVPSRCLHVTIDVFFTGLSSNWTYRMDSDAQCK